MNPAGLLFAAIAAIAWGASFPAIAQAMTTIEPLWVTAIRFGLALPPLLAVTYLIEGESAFRLEGKGWQIFTIGAVGMGGYNVFAVYGMKLASAEHAALLFAAVPLLTTIVIAVRTRTLPSPITLACILAALAGIALVITAGNFTTFFHSASFGGDALLLIASLTWVYYTIERGRFPDWPALRFTTMTLIAGEAAIVVATAIASGFFHQGIPTLRNLRADAWLFVFLGIAPVVVAILCYNAAIGRLGPARASLFINAVPVVTFAVQALRGVSLTPVEYAGAAIVLVALTANSLTANPNPHLPQPHPRIA